MAHDHHDHDHHAHLHDDAELAELLDLEAEVFGTMLDDITHWVNGQIPTPRRIVDLGAGTGTGTLAWARRVPTAEITAVDSSSLMIDRLRTAAQDRGIADRVHALVADLDDGWPDLGRPNLAWAALSLHHVADPERVMREVHTALAAGGTFAVVEMESRPHVLPDDIGLGRPGLESRCDEAIAQQLPFDAHPKWGQQLEEAGYTLVREHTFTMTPTAGSDAVTRYAQRTLQRFRGALSDRLAAEDLDTLDRLLSEDGPDSVLRRTDLSLRARRTVWLAQRR